MKKLFMIITLIAFAFAVQSQGTLVLTLANGLVGVDSISGATTTYYYMGGSSGTQNSIVSPHGTKAAHPVTQYEIHSIMAGTAHSLVTASDSTAITVQVSYDNVNWFPLPVLPTNSIGTGGGAPTIYVYTTYALLRYVQWVPTAGTCIYPYLR